uniref:RRM domain-containing protein n=1 Tax=Pelusios castaneus TaxID=367368 RepID=A0A8C8SQD5_9SAUR
LFLVILETNELSSSLLSVFEELKARYESMREKLVMGIPLDSIPPLSVESKLLSVFSSYIPSKYAHFNCLTDCTKSQEINEDWFDAKENFTVTDFSATLQRNEKEQENLERIAKNTRSEPNKHYFVHVGGLSPLVSEVDLRYHFQKYQVLEVSICEFSSTYRYASLSFKNASKAKLAMEEMNGKEIKGKTVNVRLVKTAGENTLPASQKVSKPLHCENQATVNLEKNTEVRTTRSDFDSLKVPSTTSASLKVLDQQNPLQIKSVQFYPNPSATFIPPNTLNLSSFTKLMKKLKELHPKATSDDIVDALLKVRINNKGFLSGLSINAIVEMASFVLSKSAPKCEKK